MLMNPTRFDLDDDAPILRALREANEANDRPTPPRPMGAQTALWMKRCAEIKHIGK